MADDVTLEISNAEAQLYKQGGNKVTIRLLICYLSRMEKR